MAWMTSTPTVGDDVGFDLVGELIDDAVELFLFEFARACLDVDDTNPWLKFNFGRQIGVPGPHVDMAHGAGMGQMADQLADVDVHAAAVT